MAAFVLMYIHVTRIQGEAFYSSRLNIEAFGHIKDYPYFFWSVILSSVEILVFTLLTLFMTPEGITLYVVWFGLLAGIIDFVVTFVSYQRFVNLLMKYNVKVTDKNGMDLTS
jgi:hypothetical protein